MAGSIEAFAFSDGTAKFRANNTLVVEEQPTSPATTECRLTGPLVFRDALTAWAALLYTLTPAGIYTVTYDATARRVTIATTNGIHFRPVWAGIDAELSLWLGFDPTASYGFLTSHTGTLVPRGRCDLIGIDSDPPEDAARVDMTQVRLGRAFASAFGNHQVVRLTLLSRRDKQPDSWSWLLQGRVRVYLGTDTTAQTATNLDGYLEGSVINQPAWDRLDDDESFDAMTIELAIPRTS